MARHGPRGRRLAGTAVAMAAIGAAAGCGSTAGASAPRGAPRASARVPVTATTRPAPVVPTTLPTTVISTTTAPGPAAPTVPVTTGAPAALSAANRPAPVAPLVAPVQAGEGAWQPVPGSATAGRYAVYTTELRAAPGAAPSGVAWIDTSVTRLALYAGTAEPSGTWAQQGSVAPAAQPGLLAAFNSGFKIYAYGTGWYDQGRTAVSLKPGAASLVILADGSATVGEWGVDVGAGPQVVAVRQNLHLLVDHGAPAADAGVVGDWGATLGGVVATWRSGVGVTASGDLVYVAGPYLEPAALARLLIAAGAVRAMELDINPEWVSFATYTHAGPGPSTITGAANLVSGMYYSPYHYLQPFSRDFFAVFGR